MKDIRLAVRGIYDLQKLRIQTGNRIVNHFLKKLGVEPSKAKNAQVEELTKELKAEFKRLTDGLLEKHGLAYLVRKKQGLVSNETEFALVSLYFTLLTEEQKQIKFLKNSLERLAIYKKFLKKIKGIGPLMAGVIISEIDIEKAHYVSSLWKYAGLDVVKTPDGKTIGRCKKRKCLEVVEYIAKDGTRKEKLSLSYNLFLKTKLVKVLAEVFLKTKSPYREIYDDYKNRLENHPAHKDKTKLHRHNMAKRYMIKQFLRDLYLKWRELEGLPVYESYNEAKLGMRHKKVA